MGDNETEVEYTVRVTGDQYDHEAFRETVYEVGGAILDESTTSQDAKSDDYTVPEIGDRMVDSDSNPRYGKGIVEITKIPPNRAGRHYIETETGERSVAYYNPTEPEDAPVVLAQYVGGSDKEYAFPVTRLQPLP